MMTPSPQVVYFIGIGVLVYFVLLNGGYLMLNFLAMFALRRRSQEAILDDLPQVYSALEPPISIVVPAYNEEATIATSVRSMPKPWSDWIRTWEAGRELVSLVDDAAAEVDDQDLVDQLDEYRELFEALLEQRAAP